MRRLSLSEYHVLSILSEPIKEPLQNINIELFEGDNYIYLVDMVGNKFYAEYLIKNDFTDMYVTKNEMNSAINQTAGQIELSVNQKLQGYASNEDITELNSKITQTATEINTEVAKKVGNNEIISKINQSAEAVNISASKININGVISANGNFKVDTSGNMICNNGTFTGGSIELKATKNDDGIFYIHDPSTVETAEGHEFSVYPYGMFLGAFNKSFKINFPDGGTSPLVTICGRNYKETKITADKIETPVLQQTSLKSKKKNIKKLKNNALELVKNADICEYNFKGEKKGTKKHIGLVIGDGYNCPNEVISEDGQGVEQYSLTSLLWKAVQELTAKVKKLEQEARKND